MKYLSFCFLACLLIFVPLSSCHVSDPSNLTPSLPSEAKGPIIEYQPGVLIPNQYIVILEENAIDDPTLTQYPNDEPSGERILEGSDIPGQGSAQQGLLDRNEIMLEEISPILARNNLNTSDVKQVFTGRTKGVVLNIGAEEAQKLERDEAIAIVEQDEIVALSISPFINSPFMPSQTDSSNQVMPYGVARVGGSTDWSADPNHMARWAWVIDTGVDLDHPDLNVNTFFAANFTSDSTADDKHGHGTHVAGIIAAKDNGTGVSGVAAGAIIASVKVLKNDGTGKVSDIVAGLNYTSMHAWPEDVVNVSLGGPASNSVDNAILALANKGIKVVVAAGNSNQPISQTSPARVVNPKVLVISAINVIDQRAAFSNYGSGISYAAPGVDILSTFKEGTYGYVSGTSMAAPHVTGILIVAPERHFVDGYATPDPNGDMAKIISY